MTETSTPIPLPPVPMPDQRRSVTSTRGVAILDGFIVVLTAVFVFLVSSFPIRNADHWLHLATGRMIAEGTYQFGMDPFAIGTENVRWVNHSWFYDWLVYQLRGLEGGLVVLKAMLVVAIAGLMILSARPAGSAWAAGVAALAILAASPRLVFQPTIISLFLLSITMLVLLRGSSRACWFLPLLFVIWVNVDDWFILGPIAVVLSALGRWPWDRITGRRLAVATVGLAACLFNPHHVHAFQWPMEISPQLWSSPLLEDPRIARLFDSPWHWDRLTRTSGALNPAGLAYYVLLTLGGLSFWRNREAWRDGRLALWLFFGGLGAFQARLIPFFAIASAPIVARNFWEAFHDFSNAPPVEDRGGFSSVRFRILAIVTLLVLTVAAYPGWLQAPPHELRRVGWAVMPDASLRLAAERFKTWTETQQVPADEAIFNTHPDAGAYLAWFGPRTRHVIDPRLNLFASESTARVFVSVYRTIMGQGETDRSSADRLPEQRLVLGYEATATRASDIFAGPLVEKNSPWRVFAIDGRACWFGRVGGRAFDGWSLVLNPATEAYHPRRPLPAQGGVFAAKPTFKDWYLRRPPERPVELDTAIMHLRQFDELAWRRQRGADGDPMAAALAQLPLCALAESADLAATVSHLTFRMAYFSFFVPFVDPGPPEHAYLALRQARLALIEDPNRAETWLRLGQAYLSLRLRTREGSWSRELTLLDQIRHAQIAYCLETALSLEPGSIVAHRMLANLYTERGFLDAAYAHRRSEVELLRSTGPSAEESREEHEQNLEAATKRLREMEKQLQERENQYVVQVGNLASRPYEQAQTALRLGLAQKALDEVLLKSDVRLFGIHGAQLQMHLLLMLGRAKAVWEFLLEPELAENPDQLDVVAVAAQGGPGYISEYRMVAYDWYRAMVSAVAGDYAQAQRSLLAIERRTAIDAEDESRKVRERLALLLGAEVGVGYLPEIFIYRARLAENRLAYERLLQGMLLAELLRADLRTLAGMLAMEQGDSASAEQHFAAALTLARGSDGEVRQFAGRPAAEVMLQRLKR